MSVWKIKYVVYFNYLTVRREIGTKRKRALYFWRGLTLELNWSFLKGWEGWNFGGRFGPFKLQCGFSIFQIGPSHGPIWPSQLGRFSPKNWCQKQPHFNGAELTPSLYQTGLTRFGPIFGAKATLYTVYSYSFALFSSYTAAVMPLFTPLRPVSFATGVPPFFTVALLHTCMRSFNPETQRSFVPYSFTLLHPLLNQPINNYWSTCFSVCLFGSFFFLS